MWRYNTNSCLQGMRDPTSSFRISYRTTRRWANFATLIRNSANNEIASYCQPITSCPFVSLFSCPSSHRPSQLESNSVKSLKKQISLPFLLHLTGAFLSLQLTKLIQKNQEPGRGNSSLAHLGIRFSCILLQSLICTMQLFYLHTWFMLRDVGKEKFF